MRRATLADVPVLSQLQQDFADYLRSLGDQHPGLLLTDSQWAQILTAPHLGGLVGEDRGEAVGYLAYHQGYDLDRGGPVLYVFDLFVRQAARRRGVGRALMAEAANLCAALGGTELLFNVWRQNAAAIAFYSRLGAVPVEALQYMHLPVAALGRGCDARRA